MKTFPLFQRRLTQGVFLIALVGLAIVPATRAAMPWEVNTPIVSVQKTLYRAHPANGVSIWTKQWATGPGLYRIESVYEQSSSDTYQNAYLRISSDNGRTWASQQPIPNSQVTYGSVTLTEEGSIPIYDPGSDMLIEPWLRINRYNNGAQSMIHLYYRLSADHGLTWTAPKMLRYEAGPEFNPADPENLTYLNTNNASFGQKFLVTSPGNVVLGACSANDPNDPLNNSRKERLGALNFVGAWNPLTHDYDFQAGSRIGISYNVSDRGLLETDVAQLKDGRILDVWRGSNTTTTPGHKWFSVSSDGGLTLPPPQEWKYDDGTSFYSPSSVHRFVRAQGNGKLYWIGNISPTAPSDNSPRYPLLIAEVDEDKAALKKDTVTMIIDRQPGELSSVQYSNFSVLENPETHQLELFMTNIGALGSSAPNLWNADCYKFTLTLVTVPEPSTAVLLPLGVVAAMVWFGVSRRRELSNRRSFRQS